MERDQAPMTIEYETTAEDIVNLQRYWYRHKLRGRHRFGWALALANGLALGLLVRDHRGGPAMMTEVLLALLTIEIPIIGFILLRGVRNAFAYHFAVLATQLETGGVKVHVVGTPPRG